ncbi:MAG: hypothetical protein QM764_03385 [Chitinophagaceae bacterium]
MKIFPLLSIAVIAIVVSESFKAQSISTITEYLNVSGPVDFNKKSYKLNWTSHPSANYYKQEYLAAGESADKFTSMVMLEALTGNTTIKELVAAKVNELKTMKENNPYVNYESFTNGHTGEYMLDFLVTANGADGKIAIAERNVYRYTTFSDKSGNKGVLLFGIATRSYGAATNNFITSLKTTKKELVDKVSQSNMPVVNISK